MHVFLPWTCGRGHRPQCVTRSLSALREAIGDWCHARLSNLCRFWTFSRRTGKCPLKTTCAVVYRWQRTQYREAPSQFITMNWTAGWMLRFFVVCLFGMCVTVVVVFLWFCLFVLNLNSCHFSQAANCFFADLQKDPKGPAGKASYHTLLMRVAFVYI